MASKNARCSRPTNAAMSAERSPDVSGPVAMMSGDISPGDGIRGTARRSTRISGCDSIAAVTPAANASRSTASAAPAGTRTRSATRHHQRSEPAHLLLQQADGVVELVAAKRIAADELGQPIRLVHRGRHDRPHLVDRHRHAERRRLPRGLAAGQAAADDVNHHGDHSASGSGSGLGAWGWARGFASSLASQASTPYAGVSASSSART